MTRNYLIKNLRDVNKIDKNCANRISRIFSDKTGIINVILQRFELEKYGLSMFQCLSAQTAQLFDLDREVSSGGLGVDKLPSNALNACIGEAIERYCMSYSNRKDLIYSKWEKIPKKHKLSNYDLYTYQQYKENRNFINPKEKKIYWVKLHSITNKKTFIFWPASLIYLPFKHQKPVAETSSTGTSSNTSINKAIISGLLEVIERDALMINFLKNLNPPEIDINSINDKNKGLINKIRKSYNLKIYKLLSDIKIPIYLGFIWKKYKNNIHFGIGSSANLCSQNAISKTLKECLFTYFYSKNIADLKKDDKTNIDKLYEHFLYYQDYKFYQLLFKSKVEKYKKVRHDLNYLIEELKRNHYNVYYKNLSTADIKKTGIKVVKVVIPGFIDLNKSYNLRRKAAKRFKQVPKKIGFKSEISLSKMPHPFP